MQAKTKSMPGRNSHSDGLPVARMCGPIAGAQLASGEIPWYRGGKSDPWDHVEAAMGLTIGGCLEQARRAYLWLAEIQLPDGSWFAAYHDGSPLDHTRDTNFASYIAVGLYHYHRVTGDRKFLCDMWPVVRAAIHFTLGLQAPAGEIYWALNAEGKPDPMALLTGCSSIFMSIKCALAIAEVLGNPQPHWARALQRLGLAIGQKPFLFNMTKARFAMDWYYPILAGAVTGAAAAERLSRHWKKFVVTGQGVRCVSDQPWVTVAESAELALTLAAVGNLSLARIVLGWVLDKQYDDGAFWCGHTFPEMVIWPEEKMTWTNAVVLMAADAIYQLTPAGSLFDHRNWPSPISSAWRAAGPSIRPTSSGSSTGGPSTS